MSSTRMKMMLGGVSAHAVLDGAKTQLASSTKRDAREDTNAEKYAMASTVEKRVSGGIGRAQAVRE